MKRALPAVLLIGLILGPACVVEANGCWRNGSPYGSYCRGPRRGWYGARRPVRSLGEAERIIRDHFAPDADVEIGNVVEKDRYYEAEIRDKKGNTVDKVIVDKRTGRLRSIW